MGNSQKHYSILEQASTLKSVEVMKRSGNGMRLSQRMAKVFACLARWKTPDLR